MGRSAAAGSHAAGTPGHAPEGVLAVVCLDNPRDNTNPVRRRCASGDDRVTVECLGNSLTTEGRFRRVPLPCSKVGLPNL